MLSDEESPAEMLFCNITVFLVYALMVLVVLQYLSTSVWELCERLVILIRTYCKKGKDRVNLTPFEEKRGSGMSGLPFSFNVAQIRRDNLRLPIKNRLR